MTIKAYPVNDIHPEVQRLGCYYGYPSIRVQLQGCALRCDWCDVPETWQLHTEPNPPWKRALSRWRTASIDDILKSLRTFKQRHVVLSGGEPLLHDIEPLINQLLDNRYTVQVETSGTCSTDSIRGDAHVTVSPKFFPQFPILRSALVRADEIVFPVLRSQSLAQLQQQVVPHLRKTTPVYLHVIGPDRLYAEATNAAFLYNYHLTANFDKVASA